MAESCASSTARPKPEDVKEGLATQRQDVKKEHGYALQTYAATATYAAAPTYVAAPDCGYTAAQEAPKIMIELNNYSPKSNGIDKKISSI